MAGFSFRACGWEVRRWERLSSLGNAGPGLQMWGCLLVCGSPCWFAEGGRHCGGGWESAWGGKKGWGPEFLEMLTLRGCMSGASERASHSRTTVAPNEAERGQFSLDTEPWAALREGHDCGGCSRRAPEAGVLSHRPWDLRINVGAALAVSCIIRWFAASQILGSWTKFWFGVLCSSRKRQDPGSNGGLGRAFPSYWNPGSGQQS